jgi:hypothetical protein
MVVAWLGGAVTPLAGKRLKVVPAAAAADHVRYARHTVRQIIVAAGRMVD